MNEQIYSENFWKPVLVHTDINGTWTVIFGMASNEYQQELFGKMRTRADIIVFVRLAGEFALPIRNNIEEIDSKTSAQYYVHFKDWKRLLVDVNDDIKSRGLWPNRQRELFLILEAFGVPE